MTDFHFFADYVSVVIAIIFFYAVVYWFVRGRKTFKGVKRVHEIATTADMTQVPVEALWATVSGLLTDG